VLAILSVVGGWVGIPPFMVFAEGHGSWFENFLAPSVVSHAAGAADHGETLLSVELEWILTFVSVAAAATGVAVAALMYLAGAIRPASLAATFSAPYRWLSNKWYVDEFYQALIAHPGARLASFLAAFDLGVVDGAVNGVARTARGTGSLLRNLQSGYIRGYAATMLVGVFLVVAYWAFR
ncbi:MAG TPA: NADH-quinone oxidoreductase subunit L, partial [Chloroflexota bacterium]|nr:NADH-quinone oxidoreductase subunit L [Chloroflexota bacterium]